MNEELEEYYESYLDEENCHNFKLLIDEWDNIDLSIPEFETMDITPILNKDKGLIEVDIKSKSYTKHTNNNKLF